MSIVYIVDEEFYFASNVASICRIAGYETVLFGDATSAYDFFSTAANIPSDSRILIDCALAPGGSKYLFSQDQTDDYMKTGIVLLDRLAEKRPEIKKVRVTLYTAHFTTHLWSQILEFCRGNNYNHWQKRPDAEPEDIVKLIV